MFATDAPKLSESASEGPFAVEELISTVDVTSRQQQMHQVAHEIQVTLLKEQRKLVLVSISFFGF
jgi:hypothetical protein